MTTTSDTEKKAANVAAEQSAFLAWFDRVKRDLPWRRTKDAYAIWVSEVMLQQTRVETVIPYYERFLTDYPTVFALAEAPLDDVLERWSGLGYYRRARMLHAGAQAIAARGKFPEKHAELLDVKGIGPYTAGAVASIAYDEAVPLVDGNVERVLARLRGIEEDVTKTSGKRAIWREAEALVPLKRAGDFNQALMELGATVCTPRNPACGTCPLATFCVAKEKGIAAELPRKTKAAKAKEEHRIALVAVRRNPTTDCLELLLARRKPDVRFGGLHEPPQLVMKAADGTEASTEAVAAALTTAFGVPLSGVFPLPALVHVLSHRRLLVAPYRAKFADDFDAPASVLAEGVSLPEDYDALLAYPLSDGGSSSLAPAIGLSTLAKKILASAGIVLRGRR